MGRIRGKVGVVYGRSMHPARPNTCFGEFVEIAYQLGSV
jgi:hypothetical protein